MKDVVHVTVGDGDCLLRTVAVLTRLGKAHTNPTSDVRRGSSRNGRGAPTFRGGVLQELRCPLPVLASTSIRDREAGL